MKTESGFITITFVLMIAAFLTFISLQANNDFQLQNTLIHVEDFYEREYANQSCQNLKELQIITQDILFNPAC